MQAGARIDHAVFEKFIGIKTAGRVESVRLADTDGFT